MFCAISGTSPAYPVVSKKSGHIYERDLILKYLRDNDGKDPITGDELSEEDLIDVKTAPSPAPARTPSQTSVPALLRSLQDEWDTAMMETLAVRKDAERMRQELSHALYKEDAAMRVLARLVRERDEARDALSNIQSTLGLSGAPTNAQTADAGAAGAEMEVDAAPAKEEEAQSLPEDINRRVKETAESLSSIRKKRKVPSDYAKVDDVKTYAQLSDVKSLHSAKPPGLTCLHISPDGNMVLTGGADKVVQVYDRESGKVLATAKGHTKKVTAAYFVNVDDSSGSLPSHVVSASEDSSIRIWSAPDEGKKTYQLATNLHTHKKEVTGVSVHPSSTLIASSSGDNTFAVHDISDPSKAKTLYQLGLPPAKEGDDPSTVGGATSVAFHPDGALVGVGGGDGLIRVFDVSTAKLAAVFRAPEGAKSDSVDSMSFSENGYLLATSSKTRGSPVQIWDLRKLTLVKSINTEEEARVESVAFDESAQFLAVVGTDCKVYANKTWEELMSWEDNSAEITGAAWTKQGSELVVCGMDRTLRILGKPA